MNTIAHGQSRRNSSRRARKVAARHGLAGHWTVQSAPMMTGGKIGYEIGGNIDATSFGGIGAIHRMAVKLGLVDQINDRVQLLKRHLPYHESDHVLNLAYNVACGGTRLQDLERLRHDVAYMNALGADLIPDPTTAGDFCRRFDQTDVVELMEAINAVRPKLWAGRGRELLGPIAYIDVDGTMAPTTGATRPGWTSPTRASGATTPLVVSLANTKEVLYLVNRPGNQPSHAGAADWIDRAIDLVDPHAPRICVRGDTDFSLTANFDRWAARVDFIFGMDCNATMRKHAEALDQAAWARLERPAAYDNVSGQTRDREPDHKAAIVKDRGYVNLELNYEDVAEFDYQPGKCSRSYRMIALRKNISKARGEQVLFDEIRYFFYITTRRDLTAAEIVACANQRCDQENAIEQLKNGVGALRVPLYDLVSNWAYMVCAALAWNLKSWFSMMAHRKTHRREFIAMEFRRFIHAIVLIPAMVMRRARSITIRILGWQPTLDRMFSAWRTIERTRFG